VSIGLKSPGSKDRAVLFVLAFLTKQLALVVVLGLAPISLLASRGRSWLLWLAAAILGLAVYWGLQATSQGWFSFFILGTSLQHERVANIWLFWKLFLEKFWPAALLALIFVAVNLRSAWRFAGSPAGCWHRPAGWRPAADELEHFLQDLTYDNGFMPACLGSLFGRLGYRDRSCPAPECRGAFIGTLLASWLPCSIILLAQLPPRAIALQRSASRTGENPARRSGF
jgi:hypothetical protein